MNHGDMVTNILNTYSRSTAAQRIAGKRWYPMAGELVSLIAAKTGIDKARVGFALSALSPRNPWRWNVADAYAFSSAMAEGRDMPTATTFKRNWRAAWRALGQDGSPWVGAAPKVSNFVGAIMGDLDCVVVDTWAVRIATAGTQLRADHDRQYFAIAAAYREAAVLLNEKPSVIQAITWIVAQTEGLASSRRGRHDLAFKAGTPEFIMAAISEGEVQ